MTSRDVLVVHDLFGCADDDFNIYDSLLREIKDSGVDEDKLWQSWHGDSHMIADDKKGWKKSCPTFHMVLDKLAEYFEMDVKATRFNWYRDSSEWKPFHHDAAAVKPQFAKKQNFTAAVSFGAEREAAFEHAKTKTVSPFVVVVNGVFESHACDLLLLAGDIDASAQRDRLHFREGCKHPVEARDSAGAGREVQRTGQSIHHRLGVGVSDGRLTHAKCMSKRGYP